MLPVRLIKSNLLFYRRTTLAVFLAAMMGTAVLSGALFVGDSVRYSLRSIVDQRLGSTKLSLAAGNNYFTTDLADSVRDDLNVSVSAVIQLPAAAVNESGTRRANHVQIMGVDNSFFSIGPPSSRNLPDKPDDWHEHVILNSALAEKLQVKSGDEVILRIASAGVLPHDTALTGSKDAWQSFRLPVKAIAGAEEFGRFSLQSSQRWPLNAFVSRRWLQEVMNLSGRANLLLVSSSSSEKIDIEQADSAIEKNWKLADLDLEVRTLSQQRQSELVSRRIFINSDAADKAMDLSPQAIGILTYFVNDVNCAGRASPYLMVAALSDSADVAGFAVKELRDDEIIINQWLAEDLQAQPGQQVRLSYFVLTSKGQLEEHERKFKVRHIVPMEKLAADPTLMPDFPGLSDVNNCLDWEPGIPIDLAKVRPKDEQYWNEHRGTPKAFVTLRAGRAMWSNRFGNLTAVRYPASEFSAEQINEKLTKVIKARSHGLYFQDVRQQGLQASRQGTDFGQLFVGLSMFIIAASLILTGLLFVFGVERRSNQIGIMLAVGFTGRRIRTLLLSEGFVLAVLSAIIGLALGFAYTRVVVWGLTTVWVQVVGGSELEFSASLSSCIISVLAGIVMTLASVLFALRRQLKKTPRSLLDNSGQWQFASQHPSIHSRFMFIALFLAVLLALFMMVLGLAKAELAVGTYFASGTLILIAGLIFLRMRLTRFQGKKTPPPKSILSLGLANAARRPGRSLAVVALLALGVFLVIGVGANRQNPLADVEKRNSGTGGFALIAESSIPISKDLNEESTQNQLHFFDNELHGVSFVSIRVRDGEDASCFNLNRAQKPRLLGIKPVDMISRDAFHFTRIYQGKNSVGWEVLEQQIDSTTIPAVADAATIMWGLGKSLGDEIEYIDQMGRIFRVRLVGMLQNSVFQGSIIISEDAFLKRFPHEQGYRMFLMDVPKDRGTDVLELLTSRMSDYGFEVSTASAMLASFSSVENTYLSVFEILSGFGLILGSFGLAVVVLRNVLDRRGELAMLWAFGFDKARIKNMILFEHVGLLLAGLFVGILAAVVAIAPAVSAPAARIPYVSLALTAAAIFLSGLIWIWLASSVALKGDLLECLRNE